MSPQSTEKDTVAVAESRGEVNVSFVNDEGLSLPQVDPTQQEIGFPQGQRNYVNSYFVDDEVKGNIENKLTSTDLQESVKDSNQEGNEPKNDQLNKPIVYTQILGAATASLTHITIGTIIGLPAVTLSQLTDPTANDIFLNTSQVALYSSIVHIGATLGSIGAGGLNLRLGQRVTLIITLPITLLMWILLAFTPTVWMLLTIRAILGAMQGFIGAASTNYVVEIADNELRGRLSGLVDTCRQLGFLSVYVIGSFNLTWRQIALICGCVTTIPPFIGLCFLPNSPRWLVTQGRIEEAESALQFYRGSAYNIKQELASVVSQIENTSSMKTGVIEQFREMLTPTVYPRFILLTFLMFVVHFTGNIAIATFVVPIFQAVGADINPYTSAVLMGSVRVIGIIIFLTFIDRFGRKTALIVSCITCAICLGTLGIFFFLKNSGKDVSEISWLPLLSLLIYTPFVCAIQAVTSLLRGEILPTALRALGASLMYIVFFLGMFASTQTFPEMVEITGEEGAFWVFAGSCILMAIVAGLALPETKGLSLEEIDDLFRGGNRNYAFSKKDGKCLKVP